MKRSIEILMFVIGFTMIFTSCSEDNFTGTEESHFDSEDGIYNSHKRTCGHSEYLERLDSDPELRKEHEEKLKKYNQFAANNTSTRTVCSDPTKLPVAIHYQGITSPNNSCLVGLAQTQVAILNQDYQGTNSDISTWNNSASSFFPGVSNGETCLAFVIADQNHPSGFGLSNGDLAVTINQTTGDNISQFSGYINIIVRPNTGLLGYSPVGGNGNGDGVVVDASAFGAGGGCGSVSPQAPYNLGRTLTHELGHYLLLDHIWGDGCGVDDLVSDTPDQNAENYDCPTFGLSSCGTNDMFMNYMDYVNDACMYMFSGGQSSRMENFVSSNLQNVISKGNTVLSGGTGGGGGGGSTCTAPTDPTESNVTDTQATISWTAVTDAVKYRIKYVTAGTGWTTITTTNPSVTLTNLAASKTYIYKLRTLCLGTGWTSYAAAQSFQTEASGGGGGGQNTTVNMRIKLDDYGSETTWELVNDDTGASVATGGPYQDGTRGQRINKFWSLPDGNYIYNIADSYGDGICCTYGYGWSKIIDDSNQLVAFSNGNFGNYDNIFFTVDNGTVTFKSEDKDEKLSSLIQKPILGVD